MGLKSSPPNSPGGGDSGKRVDAPAKVKEAAERTISMEIDEVVSDRARLISEAGEGDAELHARARRLVAAEERGDGRSNEMVNAALERVVTGPRPDQPGERIGDYKLLDQIGEGGFGQVWVADQEAPVRRRVALKIVKLGMDTKEVIARFEQERQALAMMDHPNIAKVFDAGATPTGRPFFVMELVRGIKITDYCDQAKLSTADRLALFITVCHAVQHAHQKGIIHRDLKPSNILVTVNDGVAVPKVIDFGVAKATQQQRLTDLTIYTQFEQMIGTPLYMSPEQAEMSGLDVDTRSDIYSLGVLLYELLSGRTPFDPHELMRKGLDEIRRTIREQEPQKPSTLLHTMAIDLRSSVARQRQADPGKLLNLIRGDLDWIVMKAIEKDRTRRYETAIELAKDIQRHLAHEPVHARAPTQWYRLRRLVRRNRLTFAAASAVAAALVIGLGAATRSLLNERKARKSEAEQRILAEHHSQEARTSAARAGASEFKATHLLYATDMHLVQEALRSNNVGLARRLLDRHRPEDGKPDLRDWEWRYLYQECRSSSRATLTRQEGAPVFAASYSPDGTLLLLGFEDGRVELWNVAARSLQKAIQSPAGEVARAVFSPGGENIAITAGKGSVKTVNVKTGAQRMVCTVEGTVRDLSYSSDGEWLSVLSHGPDRLRVLQAAGGDEIMLYTLPNGGGTFFNNARISPDKRRLYVSCGAFGEPLVRCLSIPDARMLWEQPIGVIDESERASGKDTGFSAMDLSPDGRILAVATGYRDPHIRLVDTETGQVLKKRKGHSKYILQLSFSKDGRVLASSSEDQTVSLLDTASWTRLMAPLRGHNLEVNALAVSSDGRFVASGSKDGEVLLWDTSIPPPLGGRKSLPSHIIKAVPLGSRMVLGQSSDGPWSLIDLLTLAEVPLPQSELSLDGSEPAFLPKKSRPPKPRVDRAKLGLTGNVAANAVSPDGKLVVLASETGEIGFYEAGSLAKIEILRSNLRSVFGIVFSPNGRRLVLSSGGDEGIAVWDVALRQELLILSSNCSLLEDVGFTEDGNTLLVRSQPSGPSGGACEYWQAPSFQEIDEAERIGRRWPHPEAFPQPGPAPTLASLKDLLEAGYRATLAASVQSSPEAILLRNETVENLATLLHRQRRDAEAEPLFRELLESIEQRAPRDENAVLGVTKKLLGVVLGRMRMERQAAETGDVTAQSVNADALVNEMFAILSRKSAASPEKTLECLRLATLQIWSGRKTDYAKNCRRLLDRAEQNVDDPYVDAHAVLAWCLDASGDPALRPQVLALAQKAVKFPKDAWETAWVYKAVALANYRSAKYPEAEEALTRATNATERFEGVRRSYKVRFQTTIHFIRSMILFQTGHVAEARDLLAKGESDMKPLPEDRREVFESNSAPDEIMVWLAYKEARALLRPEVPNDLPAKEP